MIFLGFSILVSTEITSISAIAAHPLSADSTSNSHSNGISVHSVLRGVPDSGTYTTFTFNSPHISTLPDSTSFDRILYSPLVKTTRSMSAFVSGTIISELILQTFFSLPISLKLLRNFRSSEISICYSLNL